MTMLLKYDFFCSECIYSVYVSKMFCVDMGCSKGFKLINWLICVLTVIVVYLLGAMDCVVDKYHGGSSENIGTDLEIARKRYAELMAKYTSQIHTPIITLDQIPDKLKYVRGAKFPKPSAHIGQRKLFMNEVQFLTEISNSNKSPSKPILVVYAGAAPSNHTGFLSSLFPKITFLLVDPNRFDIFDAPMPPIFLQSENNTIEEAKKTIANMKADSNASSRLFIINGYFTDAIAQSLKDTDFYFISDIRTNYDDNSEPGDLDIVFNLAQQFNWIKFSSPILSMLKFRHPFYDGMWPDVLANKSPYAETFATAAEFGVDFVANAKARTLTYFLGTINLQPWAGISSTETRLVTDGKTLISSDANDYEDKLYYYNSIERPFVKHINENADRKLGFDKCNDCAIENYIWKQYLKMSGRKESVKSLVAKLSKNTHRHLRRDKHGDLM